MVVLYQIYVLFKESSKAVKPIVKPGKKESSSESSDDEDSDDSSDDEPSKSQVAKVRGSAAAKVGNFVYVDAMVVKYGNLFAFFQPSVVSKQSSSESAEDESSSEEDEEDEPSKTPKVKVKLPYWWWCCPCTLVIDTKCLTPESASCGIDPTFEKFCVTNIDTNCLSL